MHERLYQWPTQHRLQHVYLLVAVFTHRCSRVYLLVNRQSTTSGSHVYTSWLACLPSGSNINLLVSLQTLHGWRVYLLVNRQSTINIVAHGWYLLVKTSIQSGSNMNTDMDGCASPDPGSHVYIPVAMFTFWYGVFTFNSSNISLQVW